MQLGRALLTQEECQRWQEEEECFYCGGVGHLVTSCPTNKSQTDLEVLIVSWADEILMDWGLARKLGKESVPLAKPIRAISLSGKGLFAITHISKPVQMFIGHHHENMQFHLFSCTSHSLILGQPWLFFA